MEIIVSSTNLGVMFKASEAVLKKYGDKTTVPESIKGQSTLSVLKSLFGGNWFDICKLKDLCKLHNIEMSNEHQQWFQSMHCIHFSDMHPETREYMFALCIEYFKPVISMSYVAS
jgi:hypothetical protein